MIFAHRFGVQKLKNAYKYKKEENKKGFGLDFGWQDVGALLYEFV